MKVIVNKEEKMSESEQIGKKKSWLDQPITVKFKWVWYIVAFIGGICAVEFMSGLIIDKADQLEVLQTALLIYIIIKIHSSKKD